MRTSATALSASSKSNLRANEIECSKTRGALDETAYPSRDEYDVKKKAPRRSGAKTITKRDYVGDALSVKPGVLNFIRCPSYAAFLAAFQPIFLRREESGYAGEGPRQLINSNKRNNHAHQ
jgi:hypothetical protein